MSNTCKCPEPPGGTITCRDDQLAVCGYRNGQIVGGCYDRPNRVRGIVDESARTLALANWVLSTVIGSHRPDHMRIERALLTALLRGEYRNPRTGEMVAFISPRDLDLRSIVDAKPNDATALGDDLPKGRPKRLLAIDGGGLAALVAAESLIEIERQLDLLTGSPAPLCERFDLIAGTSTGAILAAGLALGLKAATLRDFYLQFGDEIFTKAFLPIRFWHRYSAGPLEKYLKDVLGKDTTLGSDRLRTQILIVTKNATLGNDWFFSNNPRNKFFNSNSGIPLWQIVRASSAAPTYFPPYTIAVPDGTGGKTNYEFLDGGVSSYTNPALQVFLEATIPRYGYGWPMGVDNVLLMSLGTGFNPVVIDFGKAAGYNLIDWGRYVVNEMMNEANLQQNLLLQIIGHRPAMAVSATAELTSSDAAQGVPDESAIAQVKAGLGAQKLLTYQRITVGLTRQKLDQLGLPDVDPEKLRGMDAADQIPNMQRVGLAVAKEQVRLSALTSFFVAV
jgi:uncharacterized protein